MTEAEVPPGRWLEQPGSQVIQAPSHLWGFGALHGGLVLAVLTRAIQQADSDDGLVRSATARLHHPITGPFTATISQSRRGRASAEATDEGTGKVLASASLVTAPARPESVPLLAPGCPPTASFEECESFAIPVEFVPISAFVEVRHAGANRPYAGGDRPELTAWVRLSEDDRPPDLHRIILLLDVLAPSYAAILSTPQPIPTVELTVRPAHRLGSATSPWILLHTQTTTVTPDGWIHEHLDAWDPAGAHLASADQLRIVARPGR